MEMEPALTPNIILSDGAIRELGTNKISLIGTFHNVNVARFPMNLGFFVTPSIGNFRGRLEGLNIAIRIELKASSLVVASAAMEIGSEVNLSPSDIVQLPIPITCSFGTPGVYSVVVLVQNEVVGARDLLVSTVTAAPNTSSK